jgi:hypothetical protein
VEVGNLWYAVMNMIPVLAHLLPCSTKVRYAFSPLRHARMPREGMLKISGLPQVKRNVP